MSARSDRNLLHGILALQMDFVTRDQLISAMHAWVLDKTKTLAQILMEQHALRDDANRLLVELVDKHVELHDGDAEKSLAALSSVEPSLRDQIKSMADPDLELSLGHVRAHDAGRSPGEADPGDPYEASTIETGRSSSGGSRFRILRPHAQGGVGKVYVALDHELNRTVALKEIREEQADNQESRGRFLMEAEITGGLEHPGIVPVYGLGTYGDGRPFYAMRFIKGNSLKDASRSFHTAVSNGQLGPIERSMELRKLLGRFVDVCNAIEYAHSRGILHRDLKPGNIMLGRYGETLVVDWGLAKPLLGKRGPRDADETTLRPSSGGDSAATEMGRVLGTPAYMSPEQAAGGWDQLGPASDVYSLGATLYHVLTGRPPFTDQEAELVLAKAQMGEVPRPREINRDTPKPLEAVCLKAMALEPERRYGSPQALADDVERWLADEPVSVYKEPFKTAARRWVRRHQAHTAALVAAVAVTVVGLMAGSVILAQRNAALVAANQRADANLADTLGAIQEMLVEVGAERLVDEPQFEETRRELLVKALEFYQHLEKENVGRAEFQPYLADTLIRIGSIQADLNRHDDALVSLERAWPIAAELAEGDPNLLPQLAWCDALRGLCLANVGRADEMAPAYERALATYRASPPASMRIPQHRKCLMLTLTRYGFSIARDPKKRDVAEHHLREAINIGHELLDEEPRRDEYRTVLAKAYHNLAYCLRVTPRQKDAQSAYEQAMNVLEACEDDGLLATQQRIETLGDYATFLMRSDPRKAEMILLKTIELAERLAIGFPKFPNCRLNLATRLNNLAWVYKDLQQTETAIETSHRAAAICERLVQEYPDEVLFRDRLASQHNLLGILYGIQHNQAEVIKYRRLVREYREQRWKEAPSNPSCCSEYAGALHNVALSEKSQGNLDTAKELLQRAIDIETKAIDADASNLQYLTYLRNHWEWLKNVEKERRDVRGVVAAYEGLLQVDERLLTLYDRVRDRESYAWDLGALAYYLAINADGVDAIKYAVKAQTQLPDSPFVQFAVGATYFSRGDWGTAVNHLEDAMDKGKTAQELRIGSQYEAALMIAVCRAHLGDRAAMRNWYKKASEMDTSGVELPAHVEQLREEALKVVDE